jgi:hypothetical protein
LRINIEPYLNKKKTISEIQKQFIKNDENEIIKKIRPINSNSISKIPSNNLSNFIDDLNQKANKILNSSIITSKFEERILKKQKRKLINKEKQNSKNSTNFLNPSKSLYIKREKALMLKAIKRNINEYKIERKQKYINLKEKNKKFRKRFKSCSEIQFENYYKPMNEQRINDFSRTLKKCMSDIIIRKENFKLPEIKLNINNVYSRLYHNEVFLKKTKQKNINLDTKKNNSNINNKNTNLNKSFDENENENLYNYRNFQIKNIIQNANGKEFTMKVTPEIKKKCIFNYSCGPKKNIINDNIKINNEKEKQYLITLEQLNDENGNNNLQIAVKKHLIDFINYFLDKNIDINYQNKFGDTALHIAMNEKNISIIKLLLNHNADLLIKNKEGKTPFDIATDKIRKKLNLESIILEKLK